MTPPGKKRGRKPGTRFVEAVAVEVLALIGDGETLTAAVGKVAGSPGRRTWSQWVRDSAYGKRTYMVGKMSLHEAYELARQQQADVWAEEAIDISKIGELDGTRKDFSRIQAARLRIDSLKWAAGSIAPNRWGTKMTVAGDKDSPVTVQIVDYSRKKADDASGSDAAGTHRGAAQKRG